MAEEDWYRVLDSRRYMPWMWLVGGVFITVLALCGYPFVRKTWLVGEPEPPTIWLDHPNWKMVIIGVVIVVTNVVVLWRRKRRDQSVRDAS